MNKKYKTILGMLICVVIAVAGCGKSSDNDEMEINAESDNPHSYSETAVSDVMLETDAIQNEIVESETEEETEAVSESTSDLTVSFAYTYDKHTFIVVENTSDRAILDFSVAYTEFDKNGFSVTTDLYERGSATAANLLPGEKRISSFYGADGKYVSAMVSYIKYQGGEEWKANNIDAWAYKAINDFSVEDYESSMDALKEQAVLAENNEYLQIVSMDKRNRNQFSNRDDLDFTLTNSSDNIIESVNLRVLQYDENGLAVPTNPYDTFVKNDRNVGGTVNLIAYSTDSYNTSLFFEPTCKNYKCVVEKIVFSDGTEWKNPYIYEWIICNWDQYQ